MKQIIRYLIIVLLSVQRLTNTLHDSTSLASEYENACKNLLPNLNIRTVTNDSENTLDGAKYFYCFPRHNATAEIITWNKSALQARDYQQLFCPGRCQKDTFVISDGYGTCATIKCFPCVCDKPRCQIYGICCPDVDDTGNGITDAMLNAKNTSHLAASDCGNTSQEFANNTNLLPTPTNVGDNVVQYCDLFENFDCHLSIRSCPSYYPNNLTRTVCESELALSEQNTSTFVYVTDNETNATYFNEYCAKCNGISQFTPWNFSVNCTHFQRVFAAENDDEFLRLSLRNDSLCNVTKIPPAGSKQYRYHLEWFQKVVSKCNVTGAWAKYDQDVARSCAAPSSLVDRACYTETDTFGTTLCYKNVFCAVCNMRDYPKWQDKCRMQCMKPSPTEKYLPFSLLFNFGNRRAQELYQTLFQYNTLASGWTSVDGRNLSLECSPGKILFNGSCSSVIKTISGLAYNISILYVPKSSQNISENDSSAFRLKSANELDFWWPYFGRYVRKVDNILSPQQDYMNIQLRIIFPNAVDQLSNASVQQTNVGTILKRPTFMYLLKGFIIATSKQRRDDFENNIMRQLLTDEFTVQVSVNKSFTFTPFQETQKHLFDDYYLTKNNFSYLQANIQSGFQMGSSALINQLQMYCLSMSPQLSCPFCTFTKLDYIVDINHDVFPPTMVITLKLQTVDLEFKGANELNFVSITDTGDMRVCQHILQSKLSHLTRVTVTRTTLFLAQEILTIACISVSMLFLVLTSFTYILLLELRNTAGENIICLCSSLFFGQAFLIVASQIKETGYFCTVSGIIIHYLWLNVFCWCFTCSYNMFRVFTAKTRSSLSSGRSKKDLLRKLFVCLIAPALVVPIVILGNMISSEGKRIGYGDKNCSLDSPFLMYITLLTPILGILVSNFLFYLISVIQIHNVRKLQTSDLMVKKESSKSIYIYLKLSTVTGTFWIVTVISEATDIDALRILAILLNGLQGVLIFLSFVCNKRVFNMYKHQLGF